MKFNTFKARVNIGVSIFLVWMIVQFFRATFGGEPYPAIYLPGFPGNGSQPVESRELYVKQGNSYVLVTHNDAPFGHSRFRKLVRQFSKAVESENDEQILRQAQGLTSIRKVQEGDSIKIVEVVWLPSKDGYIKSSGSEIRYKLEND